NLSAFEVFFDERRPFFTEGSQLLRGNGPSYFYSRRIGARPSCNASGDFVDCPQNATIVRAAMITGRLASGTSLGVLTAVPRRVRGGRLAPLHAPGRRLGGDQPRAALPGALSPAAGRAPHRLRPLANHLHWIYGVDVVEKDQGQLAERPPVRQAAPRV